MSPNSPPHPCRIRTCSALIANGTLCPAHRGKVTVVYGSPGSGKTTWVEEQKQGGDLVWDFDVVMTALTRLPRSEKPEECIQLVLAMKDALVREMADHSIERAAWIIVTHEDEARRIAERLGGKAIEVSVAEAVRQERLNERHQQAVGAGRQ